MNNPAHSKAVLNCSETQTEPNHEPSRTMQWKSAIRKANVPLLQLVYGQGLRCLWNSGTGQIISHTVAVICRNMFPLGLCSIFVLIRINLAYADVELGGMTKNLYHGIFLNYTGFTVYDGIYFFHAWPGVNHIFYWLRKNCSRLTYNAIF